MKWTNEGRQTLPWLEDPRALSSSLSLTFSTRSMRRGSHPSEWGAGVIGRPTSLLLGHIVRWPSWQSSRSSPSGKGSLFLVTLHGWPPLVLRVPVSH